MTKQVIDELRALLFGEEPYTRPRAPEPELFVELIPILPKSILDDVVLSVGNLGGVTETQRALLFIALAELLPEAERGMHAWIETMLGRVRYKGLSEEEIKIFAEMARQLSEPLKSDVLNRVLSTIETVSWDEDRARALIELAPYLPEELLPKALDVAQAIKNKWWKTRALSALYPFLANADRESIADEVAATSGERLRKLLAQLPPEKRAALLVEAYDKLLTHYGGAPQPLMLGPEPLSEELFEPEPAPPAPPPSFRHTLRRPRLPPQERTVSTGFSSQTRARKALDRFVPLAPERSYFFWFEVGPPVPGAIDVKPEPLMVEFLPSEARLKVALFAFEGEIEITPDNDVGEIQIMPDGKVRVARQVVRPDSIPSSSNFLKRRLFFPVRTPNKEGIFRLRCNIYYEQILIRSRLVQVRVSSEHVRSATPALQTTVEYTMSKTINPNYLVRMKPQSLSLMLNDNSDGTHCFRIFGEQDYKSDASFNALELKSLIDKARGALRYASWKDEGPWTKNKHYRYKGNYNQDRLKNDLIHFAIRGYRFYSGLTVKIAPGIPNVEKLENLTLKPITLEFVIKDKTEASNYMFPTAMIYDYPLNTSLKLEDYTLCSSFLRALKAGDPLEEARCFKGDCPSRGDDTVICPSGFWGFRHSIGMPLGSASETSHEMMYKHAPELTVAVFPSFNEWPSHQQALKSLRPRMVWNFADTRLDTFMKLKSTNPHLVYFYCHGGIEGGIPYIKVGGKNEMGITPENLFNERIWWKSPKPLVFINGCHTTALEPKMALNFVTSFIKTHNAAGVIGTEIAIFEQLARAFAEECLHRFLVKGETIGDAVRGTRLKLLEQGNPLGLVYIIYANASLRLKKAGEPSN